MARKKRQKKQEEKKIQKFNYQQKIIELLEKKYSYFALGASVLIIVIYFIFKTNIISFKNIGNKKPVQEIKKSTSAKKEISYQVQEGDTLWSIAEKFYGSGFNMEDIIKVNKINNPDKIEKNQILIIPSVKPKKPTKGEINNIQTEKVEETKNFYIVQPGDNLWQIALKNYGDGYAWPKIAQANNLVNPDIIEPGTKLVIPR